MRHSVSEVGGPQSRPILAPTALATIAASASGPSADHRMGR